MTAQVIAVVGACGGVGASTLAALLAEDGARRDGSRADRRSGAGRRGRSVALVDLGGVGGGIEVLLGLEERPGARWPDLGGVRGTVDARDLEDMLPVWAGVEVLSGDRRGGRGSSAEALAGVWTALVGGHDLVVADVPAHALVDRAVQEVVLGARAQLRVLTGQDVAGVAAALALGTLLGHGLAGAELVLRRTRQARVSPLEAAHLVGLPLAGLIPTDRAVAAATERGLGPVVGRRTPLARAVRRLGRRPPAPTVLRDGWLDAPAPAREGGGASLATRTVHGSGGAPAGRRG